jgi:hypothetical protein
MHAVSVGTEVAMHLRVVACNLLEPIEIQMHQTSVSGLSFSSRTTARMLLAIESTPKPNLVGVGTHAFGRPNVLLPNLPECHTCNMLYPCCQALQPAQCLPSALGLLPVCKSIIYPEGSPAAQKVTRPCYAMLPDPGSSMRHCCQGHRCWMPSAIPVCARAMQEVQA